MNDHARSPHYYGELISGLTLSAIQAEAIRAHILHGDDSMLYQNDHERLAILMEEIGEVARELNEARIHNREVDKDKLEKELIQSAAMCATWIEGLNPESYNQRNDPANSPPF